MKREVGFSTLAMALAVLIPVAVSAATLVQTGFESSEPEAFAVGTSIANYASSGWSLDAGTATIANAPAPAAEGTQFLSLAANTEVDRSLPTSVSDGTQNGIVWVQAWFRGEGSAVDSPTYPSDPPASSIVHFSKNNGILLYDGNIAQGQSPWVTAEGFGDPLTASDWYQVTLLQDYTNKIWFCYINGVLANSAPLGFRDKTTVNKLSGFKNLSDTQSYFDGLMIASAIRGDANGDGVVDAADVVRALDLSRQSPPAIQALFGKNADVANASGQALPDGVITQQDYQAIAGLLLQTP